MSNRSVVFEKLNALVAQVPNCRIARTIYSHADPKVPISLVVDPLDRAARFRPGDERDNYAICLAPGSEGRYSVRLEAPPTLHHLSMLIYQNAHRYKSRRYAIQADGSFNAERVTKALTECVCEARQRHVHHSATLDRKEEARKRRLDYARLLRDVLGEPLAFAGREIQTQEDLAREHDPFGRYQRADPFLAAHILEAGNGVRFEAEVHNPETFARILELLRRESVK